MIEPIEVEVNPSVVNVEVLDSKDIDLSISKREFNIVGDNVYIEKTSSHAPQWLADFVAATVDTKLNTTMDELDTLKNTILDEMSIVENQYTAVVNQLATTEASMVSRVDTLNATVEDTAADIVNIQQTYATLDAANTISASVLQSSLDSGNIKSAITSLSNTFVTPLDAVSNSIEALNSSLLDPDTGLVISNAEGLEALSTYVGTNVAEASYDQSLSAYLVDGNGDVGGATSKVSNLAYTDSFGNIKSKFEYNSDVTIDGTTYPSNFGLATSTAGGIPTSEFWINADKFKMTNSDGATPNSTPVFSIDTTSGANKVVFNGQVTFGNNQTGTVDEAISAVVNTVAVGDKNINITDNLVPTTSFVADTDNSGYQLIGTCNKAMASGLDTFVEAQCTLVNGSSEMYSPYVAEMSLPYYYRFGIKGITSLSNFKIVTINSSNVVTYGAITITLNPGVTLVATNWYEVDGIINPVGGIAGTNGSIRNSLGVRIGTVDNFTMPTGAIKLILGWIGPCVVSRMKLSKITAETLTGVVASTDFVENMTAELNADLSFDIAAAQAAADAANAAIADIASDNILSANEKPTIIADYSVILAEQAGIDTQATLYDITTEKTAYDDAITALTNYLLTLTTPTTWNVLTGNTTIVGTTFRLKFNNVYTAKQALLNAIDDKARFLANTAQSTANTAQSAANTAQSTADSKMAADELNFELARTTTVIDGGRITTGQIDAQRINTTGLIAENISGTNIIGKTITGGSIYGAYLEGAVIKASYIDLDGELQVLTNYHIPVSSYNPSTMPGAIYIASTNEYRLPSLSSIFIPSTSLSVNRTGPKCTYGTLYGLSVGDSATQNGVIYLYDSYQYTTSLRFVKQRPVISINQNTTILSFTARSSGTYMNIDLYFAGIYLGRFNSYIGGCSFNGVSVSDSSTNAYGVTSGVITSKGFSFTISTNAVDEYAFFSYTGYWLSYNSLNMLAGQVTVAENVSANYGFKAVVVARTEDCYISSPSFVTPNMNILNML